MWVDRDFYDKGIKGATIPYICDTCGSFGLKTRKLITVALKDQQKNMFCSRPCYLIHSASTSIVPCKCTYCNKAIFRYKKELTMQSNHFCDHSCHAQYSNKKRIKDGYSIKHLSKTLQCSICNTSHILHIGRKNNFICTDCAIHIKKPTKLSVYSCLCCHQTFNSEGRRTCSDSCRLSLRVKSGKQSAAVQSTSRRSKNEILFAEKCISVGLKIMENAPIFNGWDADVIIPAYNVAVLWNGVWHYKKITHRHSVEQVANRDKIKIKEILTRGYTPYIIKNMGKHDPLFVEEQFNIFIEWLQRRVSLHLLAFN